MDKNKKKMLKTYFVYLGSSIIPFILIIYLLYSLSVTRKKTELKLKNKVTLRLIKEDLEENFIDTVNDIKFLSNTPQLKSILHNEPYILENENYLEGYLKIKNNYVAGNIINHKNDLILEETFSDGYLKRVEETKKNSNKNKIFVSKVDDSSGGYITKISSPILGDKDNLLGSVSLYKDQKIWSILDKYSSTGMISKDDFYWFGISDGKVVYPREKAKDLLEEKPYLANIENGSLLSKDSLLVFKTIDFSEIYPELIFDEGTPHLWRLLVRVPKEKLIEIKRDHLEGFILLGIFVFLLFAIALWAISKEYYNKKFYEEQLKLKNSELVKSNKTKDKFISILAHDLKNPFTGVTGIFNILTKKYDTYDENKRKKLIFSLNDSIQGINSLLLNLLEWTKVQRDNIEFSATKIKVSDIIETALKPLKLDLETKNIKLLNFISKDHYIWGDKYMVETIFRNIISNAIKFTPNLGEIELKSAKRNGYIYIYIRDNGVGMSLEIQNKIFKLDENITTPGTENEKGTGFGLILSKEFVELNKGEIKVISVEGEGSTFILKLPSYKEE